jgi:serine/threonine protein kinase
MRSRGKQLLNSSNGFPDILERNRNAPFKLKGEDKTFYYVVMEKLGPSLYDISTSKSSYEKLGRGRVPIFGGFPLGQVALIAQQLIRRLQVMHTKDNTLGLTHNDIKPDNVLVGNGDRDTISLIDFDTVGTISQNYNEKGKVRHVQGSYEFSGTDALLRKHPSAKSDLDSLGQLIIWMAAGQLPWVNSRKDMDNLALEKDDWRNTYYNKRDGLGPLANSAPFEKYFEYVESLKNSENNVDYDYLYHLFDGIADKHVTLV